MITKQHGFLIRGGIDLNTESTKLWQKWTLVYPKGFKCFSNGKEYVVLDDLYEKVLVVLVTDKNITVFKPIPEASYTINIQNKTLTVEVEVEFIEEF